MTAPVLDASALLTLLLDEPGAARVRAVLVGAIMTTVNLGEVVGHFARSGASEADIRAVLDPLPIERVDLDAALAYDVGLLLPATKRFGLSFGDRACLALGRRCGTKVFTSDRTWSAIGNVSGVDIQIIR